MTEIYYANYSKFVSVKIESGETKVAAAERQ
jgi:hypothetical protein